MVTGEAVATWLSRLVQIPSVTPAQAGPPRCCPLGVPLEST
jgi:hypothetical protein